MHNLENDGKKWTWEETLIAFDLYSRIPYSKISSDNSEIISIAKLLKRKPGAVAKKLFNIASNDPEQLSRGVSGLSHSSKIDKEIWDKFEEDSFIISVDCTKAFSKLSGIRIEKMLENDESQDLIEEKIKTLYGEDKEVKDKARIGQHYFRYAVLSAYHSKCCVTGISEPKLLIASHIKPWRDSDMKNERMNPRNGLCLNALHDKAFDKGFITLNDKYEVVLSSRIKECDMDAETQDWFFAYKGKQIALPDKFLPSKDFIHYHNDEIFIR